VARGDGRPVVLLPGFLAGDQTLLVLTAYSKRRTQFGKPLVSFQIIQDRLVRMLAEVTAMQLYCLQIGRLAERGQLTDSIAGLAKLNNTRKARQVCAEARDMLGGNGILVENHVIRHMADIEAIHTYQGTETMQTLIVAGTSPASGRLPSPSITSIRRGRLTWSVASLRPLFTTTP
jgi:alkylation response protein AidB-like acyl-CoA dehydrogenase